MNLARLQVYFETSPALRLLRSPNAAFIVDFLNQQFKRPGRIAVPFSDLHAALAAYQESVQEPIPMFCVTSRRTICLGGVRAIHGGCTDSLRQDGTSRYSNSPRILKMYLHFLTECSIKTWAS